MKWLLLLAVVYQAHSAVCEPRKFNGAYGFQLSGDTTISGNRKPAASIGRLVLDDQGKVSGYASVNFTGLLLGNPVTGTYELKTDCSLNWSLQDDSGAYQHFSGTITPDFVRAQYRQTDPGGASHGLLVRTAKECGLATLGKSYAYSISGSTTPMLPGDSAHAVSSSGTITVGEAGKLQIVAAANSTPGSGAITVDADCIAQVQLSLPAGVSMNLRGVLLDEGREMLAIQTDPGTTVTARFTVK